MTVTSRASRLDVIVRFANGGSFTPEDLALIEAIRDLSLDPRREPGDRHLLP